MVLFCLGALVRPRSSELKPSHRAIKSVSDTRKYDRGLTHLLRDELHWLNRNGWFSWSAVQSVRNSSTVCDGMRHPELRHCQSAATAVCKQPLAARCSYRITSVRCLTVGPSLWLARWSGTDRDMTHFSDSFRCDLKTIFLSILAYTCALFSYYNIS